MVCFLAKPAPPAPRVLFGSDPFLVEFEELGLPCGDQHYLGQFDGHSCYALDLPEGTVAPAGMAFEGLRKVYGRLDEDLFWLAARAVQIKEPLTTALRP